MILTLYGFWTYDKSLFNNIEVDSRLNKNLLLTYIFEYAGSNEVRYSEPAILKMVIETFFKTKMANYSRMLDALLAEYSPIENYDRIEERTLNIEKTNNENNYGNNDYTDSRTTTSQSDESIVNSKDSTNENTVSAYNSTNYQPSEKNTASEAGNSTDNITASGSDDLSHKNNFSSTKKGNETQGHTENLRAHGNIGVTTNQQMVREEIELRKLNIYEIIALDFESYVTLTVY